MTHNPNRHVWFTFTAHRLFHQIRIKTAIFRGIPRRPERPLLVENLFGRRAISNFEKWHQPKMWPRWKRRVGDVHCELTNENSCGPSPEEKDENSIAQHLLVDSMYRKMYIEKGLVIALIKGEIRIKLCRMRNYKVSCILKYYTAWI